jgi:hypothetical protein
MKDCKCKQTLKLNIQKDIEETLIRLLIANDEMFKLELLTYFRPNASLRSINNTRAANITMSKE